MKRLITLLFVALTLALASPASAQEAAPAAPAAPGGNGFGEGATSLSLGVPGGGNPYASGTFGIWYGLSGDMNLGINVGLGIDTATEPDSTFNLLLAPALKYYMMPGAEVTPFILGQLNFSFTSLGDDAVDLGLLGGFGAEWFITDVFSLAGYTGLGIDLLRPNEVDPLRIGTFTSGFSAQIYW